MTREIKFRAWDNEKHKYVGDCVIGFKTYGVETSVVVCPNSQEYAYDSCHDYYKEGRFIIEQSTGLKDKNGKEIYEGDIVKLYGDNYVVKWSETNFAYIFSNARQFYWLSASKEGDCRVIGNIHENPELLEGEK